jgi:hypothetical protein
LLFPELYDRLDRARWSLNDIDFSKIDLTKVDSEVIHDIKHINLTELSSVPATRMFMRDFAHDMDFQRFVAVWTFEEGKHSLLLEKWLNAVGVELQAPEMVAVNIEFEPAPWIETLTMHFLGEQRLGMWYAGFSGFGQGAPDKSLEEPVLKQSLKLMAQDEWRHAGCYFAFLKKAVADQPEYLENIAKMTLWMLRNKYRHPTNITEPSVMGQLEDPQYCTHLIDRFVTPTAEKVMEERCLKHYSILANTEINTPRELARFLRNKFGAKSLEKVEV